MVALLRKAVIFFAWVVTQTEAVGHVPSAVLFNQEALKERFRSDVSGEGFKVCGRMETAGNSR